MLLKVNNKGTALLAVAEQMATQCEKFVNGIARWFN
jgi:hypothetical protein